MISTNKAIHIADTIRRRLRILERMDYIDKPLYKQIVKIDEDLESLRLVNTVLNDVQKVRDLEQKIGLYKNNNEWLIENGLKPYEKASIPNKGKSQYSKLMRRLAENQTISRKMATVWQATQQTEYAFENDWFIIFDTLTIDRAVKQYTNHKGEVYYVQEDFDECVTRHWHNYRKRIAQKVGIAVYGSARNARNYKQEDYIHHLGCVEYGEKTGRIHMHVVFWCKDIPDDWKIDPNANRTVPNYREIPAIKRMWPFGYSTPIAVRISPVDAWAKAGYRWPVDRNTGVELKISGPAGVGAYVAKYLGKGKSKWRTRKSRGLGQQKLMTVMLSMPKWTNRALMEMPQVKRSQKSGRSVPTLCVRSVMKRIVYTRHSECLKTKSMLFLMMKSRNTQMIGKQWTMFVHLMKTKGPQSAVSWLSKDVSRTLVSSERYVKSIELLEQLMGEGNYRQVRPLSQRGIMKNAYV